MPLSSRLSRNIGVRRAVPLAAVLVFMLALYAWRLDDSPPYLADDEVVFALQAQSIAATGRDLSGRFMPLYFQMSPLGETSWFHPALIYFTAPFLQVQPLSEAIVRFPSAVVALIDVALIYFIALRVFGQRRLALLSAILLGLTPAHFMQGRIAADYIYPVPFVLAWLLCLLIFLERQKPLTLFVGTTFLGLGVYSYIASVIMMPVYFIVTLAVVAFLVRRPLRSCAIASAGFVWPLLLIPLWLYFHPYVVTQTLARYGRPSAASVAGTLTGLSLESLLRELRRPGLFSNVTGRMSLFWYFFDPVYLFVTGGYASAVNSTRHTGVFLLPLMVFVPVGVWQVATTFATVPARLLLVGFFSAPIAALAVPEPYAIDRELAIVAFGVLLATLGISAMMASSRRWIRRSAAVLLLLVPFHFAFFQYDYYTGYRGQSAFWFGYNHRGAVEDLIVRATRQNSPAVYLSAGTDRVIEAYWQFATIKHHREDLLSKTVYFDSSTLDVAKVPPGSLLLATRGDVHVERIIASGGLVEVAEIPEIADPPTFLILRR